jgi:hypothetical protein
MTYLYLLMVVWVVLQVFWPVNPSASWWSSCGQWRLLSFACYCSCYVSSCYVMYWNFVASDGVIKNQSTDALYSGQEALRFFVKQTLPSTCLPAMPLSVYLTSLTQCLSFPPFRFLLCGYTEAHRRDFAFPHARYATKRIQTLRYFQTVSPLVNWIHLAQGCGQWWHL